MCSPPNLARGPCDTAASWCLASCRTPYRRRVAPWQLVTHLGGAYYGFRGPAKFLPNRPLALLILNIRRVASRGSDQPAGTVLPSQRNPSSTVGSRPLLRSVAVPAVFTGPTG